MTFNEFNKSLLSSTPPENISLYLQSMWYDAKQDWTKAHTIIQDIEDNNASWIHAYLHRKEGDISNAGYWYRKAAKPMPAYSLAQEWKEMVNDFL